MSQILNIFRKDTRRFWPEILLSVVITFAFAAPIPTNGRRSTIRTTNSACKQSSSRLAF